MNILYVIIFYFPIMNGESKKHLLIETDELGRIQNNPGTTGELDWSERYGQELVIVDLDRERIRTLPLIFVSYWLHLLLPIILIVPYYFMITYNNDSTNLQDVIALVRDPIFISVFYIAFVLVFILTMTVLHLGESRIRNKIFSRTFFFIITIEMTLLYVVTVIYLSTQSSIPKQIASFQIGVILANIILILLICTFVSTFYICTTNANMKTWVYIAIAVTYSIMELLGMLMYGSASGIIAIDGVTQKMRAITITVSTLIHTIFTIGIICYSSYTVNGKHRLFGQNRTLTFVNVMENDPNISITSYVVSMYNELAWCLKWIAYGLCRPRPSSTPNNSSCC
jgi:hypothetical protein